MFAFWRLYLLIAADLTILAGLAFAFGQELPGIRHLTDTVVAQVTGSADPGPAAAALVALYNGLTGALTVAVGVAVAAIAYYPFSRGERWAAPAIALTLMSWYAVDTTAAALSGATVLVVFNTVLIAAFAPPLIFACRRTAETRGLTSQQA